MQLILALVASMMLASFGVSNAQQGGLTGNLSGKVVSASGPVSGASVTLSSPSGTYKQTTDGKGNFLFLNVSVDTYVFSVEASGYEPLGRPGLTVTGGITNDLGTITISKTNTLKTIVRVNAHSSSSAFQPSQTVPQFTVGGAVLEAAQGKTANSSEQSVLLAAPGFQLDKMGGLILDGGTTDEVHFFFDGVDFTSPGFNTNGNNYFFNGIANTQIVPGAGDPSQGDSGVGSVNLIVKRGTYPGSGLVDAELTNEPFLHQLNLEYGIATKNNSVSDFFSFFGENSNFQIGPYGTPALQTESNGELYNAANYNEENDFVNNFVLRFGKNNNQSLQFLYYTNYTNTSDDYSGVFIPYDNQSLQYTVPYVAGSTGLTNAQAAALITHEPGEYPGANASQPDIINQTTLLKLEYNNQLDSTTALDLRYFNANYFQNAFPVGAEENYPNPYPLAGQTSGGSRTGGVLSLTKQAGTANLLTLTASAEDARPNFGSVFQPIGVESLGANAALFVRPNAAGVCSAPGPNGCLLATDVYTNGNTPLPPALDLDSVNLQHFYGLGFRDQIQATSRLRLDLGVRYDLIDEGFGNSLAYEDENTQPVQCVAGAYCPSYYVADYGNVEHPHFIEPRTGVSYKISNDDSVAFTYGKSINETGSGEQASPENFDAFQPFTNVPLNNGSKFSNDLNAAWVANGGLFGSTPNLTPTSCYPNIPFAVGAGKNAAPDYNGRVGGNLQLGKPCANLGELLYFEEDAYYPEIAAVVPSVFENYDFNYSHQLKSGAAFRIAPFYRQGKDIQVATAPLIFNPATGTYTFGSLVNQPGGKNTTTGLDVNFTLPDRPVGFTGFVSATYINEFTNTPPAGDNPYGQDFEPYVLPQSYATGDLYRAGFVSPVTANLGIAYKFKSGFRINPVLHVISGYPYNPGSLTPYLTSNAGPQNVPSTNLTDQFGAEGAPSYVDPANPGSIVHPVIAATRGETESVSGGGLTSRPQLYGDVTLEYSPPNSRSTFGVVFQDIFDNEFYSAPEPNQQYYAVTNGVAAPLTGQSITGLAYPGLANITAKATYPYAAFTVPFQTGNNNLLPFNVRFYYQLHL